MSDVEFGLFEPTAGVDATRRRLPHWFQPNVAVFITFRTADSLPRHVVADWKSQQREWLRRHGIPLEADASLPDWGFLPKATAIEFRRHSDRLWHGCLDRCHGECLLRCRELAELVRSALLHFDGDRYDVDSLVVMPNHVHLLVQFRPPTTCRKQCESWLRYTARAVNQHLGRRGAFWQSEPFGHLVRSVEQFEHLRRYIAENGPRANLPESDYLHWQRGSWKLTPE